VDEALKQRTIQKILRFLSTGTKKRKQFYGRIDNTVKAADLTEILEELREQKLIDTIPGSPPDPTYWALYNDPKMVKHREGVAAHERMWEKWQEGALIRVRKKEWLEFLDEMMLYLSTDELLDSRLWDLFRSLVKQPSSDIKQRWYRSIDPSLSIKTKR
jgi:hypothetical protein